MTADGQSDKQQQTTPRLGDDHDREEPKFEYFDMTARGRRLEAIYKHARDAMTRRPREPPDEQTSGVEAARETVKFATVCAAGILWMQNAPEPGLWMIPNLVAITAALLGFFQAVMWLSATLAKAGNWWATRGYHAE